MADKIGLGLIVAYESATPGTYTAVGDVREFDAHTITVDTVDVTNFGHTDGFRRFIAALADAGEVSFTISYDPALTVYTALQTIATARALKNWKFTYLGGANTIVSAILTSLGRAVPLDDSMTVEVTLKVSGAPTEAAS
jgi:hypothetical protein